jgi:hypothetical protein
MKSFLPPPLCPALAGLGLVLTLSGCSTLGPPIKEGQHVTGAAGNVVNVSQGWGQQEQQLFYFTTQGSQLLPYEWFLVLEQARNTNRFRSDENMERLGWLPSRPTRLNPDGLPVGFVKDVDRGKNRAYVGFTCAACHTAQFKVGSVSLRIDGGPTMADTQGFLEDLADSMVNTLGSPSKFERFARGVLGERYADENVRKKLRLELRTARLYIVRRVQRNASPSPYGHARLDAFGNILNEVLAYGLNLTNNIRPSDAPVSYPFLWDTPQSDRVQWNGVAENNPPNTPKGLGPLGRNVGEVLGVFGRVEINPNAPEMGYRSSANLVNLGRLEGWVTDLWSPQWPARYLPPLDPAKVQRGKEIYGAPRTTPITTNWALARKCSDCHEVIQRTDRARRFNVVMTPVPIAGTDPTMALNFVKRRADTGRLQGTPVTPPFGQELFPANTNGAVILSNVGRGVILRHPVEAILAAFEGDAPAFEAPAASPYSYKARPLNGIWATAPYLHNGSVPNLWELLRKPDDRVKTFYVGSREFDAHNVGLVTNNVGSQSSLLDTSLPGNSNAGHPWGTELTDAQKWDLIEYLKSL